MSYVTGHLVYANGIDYSPNELVRLKYLSKFVDVSIDAINETVVRQLLTLAGVPANKIFVVKGYGSSSTNVIEIFFAYEGVLPVARVDVGLENRYHRKTGYAIMNGLIIPSFTYLSGLQQTAESIAQTYPTMSFMVKGYSIPSLPEWILPRALMNGALADMRWIPGSWKFVDAFKALNWKTIWFKDINGIQRGISRPVAGW